jgi:hypothetical protein
MTRQAWQERIVGERMKTDERFSEHVAASEFTRQQWGLIMTAVEFEIEHPDDPERARLVADTSNFPSIMPELDEVERRMSAMGGAGAPGDTGGGSGPGGGLVDAVKGALGLGGGGGGDDAEREAAAAELVQAYADELQTLLEERGRWDEIRSMAADAES